MPHSWHLSSIIAMTQFNTGSERRLVATRGRFLVQRSKVTPMRVCLKWRNSPLSVKVIHERVAVERNYPCMTLPWISLERLPWPFFLCNRTRIWICWSHCFCNPCGFDLMTVTPTYLNLSLVAHEISSWQPSKVGKFEEGSYTGISFLHLLSNILKLF